MWHVDRISRLGDSDIVSGVPGLEHGAEQEDTREEGGAELEDGRLSKRLAAVSDLA